MHNIRLPAEWEPQSGVMLTWPHGLGDWQPWLQQVDQTFADLATQISRRQSLIISCYDESHQRHVRKLLSDAGADPERVRLYIAPSNDCWVRDHGPMTIDRDGQAVLLDFRFNGWGLKYPHDRDDQITKRLYAAGAFGNTPLESVDLILEGGSIESDGQGTLLTTRRCLLSMHRNGFDQQQLQQRLIGILGSQRILWLQHGYIVGDDTDGHIDTLARFCDPQTIAYQSCEDESDEHFAELNAMEQELKAFHTAAGNPYRLLPLPLPSTRFNSHHQRLPAGYANFLIINGAVLVPTYHDPADEIALERLRSVFPGREVIGVSCATLIQQYGSLHCVTLQLPQGVLSL